MENNELCHYGVLGMRWGVRRYQNEDGTLTTAGKRRKKETPHEDYTRAHDRKKVSEMSDKELQQRLNRLNNEEQYRKKTAKPSVLQKGKKFVMGAVAMAGTIKAAKTAYKFYKDEIDGVIDKVGDMVLDDIRKNGL